ncbi:MAG: amidohydrolase family protein [Opitutaceae bacterium]
MRIIDAHTHPVSGGKGTSRTEVEALVSHGRSLGVEHMLSLGDVLRHGRFPTEAQITAINSDSAKVQQFCPGYFSTLCFLNPTLGERAVNRELERCLTQHRFVGIKLEICNNASDACMKPVMAAARRWNLPVLQHTWSMTHIRQRSFHTDPIDTATLARRNPDVTIIMAHLTGCETRGVLEIKDLPNVYIDTSGGPPVDGLVEYAVEQLGVERVLHGSDLPGRAVAVSIERIRGARLTAAEKHLILFANAARLLRLPS